MKRVARYAERGLGYELWSPGNRGLPEYWFGSYEELSDFAQRCGWTLRRLG